MSCCAVLSHSRCTDYSFSRRGTKACAHRCSVDDFCQVFEHQWQSQLLSHELQVRKRKRSLCLSQVMTILISFHQSYYRNFKSYDLEKGNVDDRKPVPDLLQHLFGKVFADQGYISQKMFEKSN